MTVSRSFRNRLAVAYPGLGSNEARWRFISYLIFGNFFDEDSGRLIVDQKVLAECEGRPLNHYHGEAFLGAFQCEVMSRDTFRWTSYRKGKCRQVLMCEWVPEIAEALEEEWANLHHSEGRVYVDDGSAFSEAKRRSERRDQQREAIGVSVIAGPEVQRALDYMNGLPPHLFTKRVHQNIESAKSQAQSIADAKRRNSELRILAAIRDQPQPFYRPSMKGKTDRIFAAGNSLTALRSDIRKVMCAGWSEADLTQCQLAIIAKEWAVAGLEAYLKEGGKMWDHLIETLGHPPIARALLKSELKQPLYAIPFGMRKSDVQGFFSRNLSRIGISSGGARLLASPLIQELFDAREQAADRIRADRGGATCFGRFLPLGPLKEKQILAIQAQAIEMSLLLPVIELAEMTDDFAITLWQHDGIAVNFTRRRDESIEKINRVVKEKTDSHGIHTSLEWEHLKTDYIQTHPPTGEATKAGVPPYSITDRTVYVGDGRKGAFKNLPQLKRSSVPAHMPSQSCRNRVRARSGLKSESNPIRSISA